MTSFIQLSILSIFFISSSAYPMETDPERELQNILEELVNATNTSQNVIAQNKEEEQEEVNYVDNFIKDIYTELTEPMQPFCLNTILAEAPPEAYYLSECPHCHLEFSDMKKNTLELNMTTHFRGKKSDKECASKENEVKIIEPTQFFYVTRKCPLFKQKKNNGKPCNYTKKLDVDLRSLTRSPEALEKHLLENHQKITPNTIFGKAISTESLEKCIQWRKTTRQVKRIIRRKRSASDFENCPE